ncbi:ligand-binding protein SH3 [Bifidobacterium sp. DSM 109958]|uniref:Ligand-binding protein SH3 n=1 Tax=Bifidobacterium moraviense TaxID=2675323 RepID=A0A7Y0F051_9BIFI|nr:multidrug efflux SMR transporter [Bifidobacterium sp. DSM 109958]NMM99580.1 ligand-binding protein SH3 [Bifidobacterium sp. DSM 109958]
MAWFVLIVSGICESVWAIALDRSAGFSRLVPTVVFVLGLVASMGGLGYAMRHLPVGTSYAVWVGIGAAITAAYGMASGEEPISCARVLLVAGLVACVIGLRFVR